MIRIHPSSLNIFDVLYRGSIFTVVSIVVIAIDIVIVSSNILIFVDVFLHQVGQLHGTINGLGQTTMTTQDHCNAQHDLRAVVPQTAERQGPLRIARAQ